ncbi:hypothetical protein B0T11DRAFT_86883 [Plectosphaerella cucumerina]|jgi:hypothetical protein|uniref:Uncharacterized protein n=1 Tax=Plectosphaerella cucumerina TaxID=40658 RepID=A0A8K0TIG2_9PEZI|nr:hypothetical protein B0T11DRAFT_86883 [Plectosphaerella cucumerina]
MSTNCANNTLPTAQSVGVPEGVYAVLIPNTGNGSIAAMESCCGSSEVHRAGDGNCTLWCELPDDFVEDIKDPVDEGSLSVAVDKCLERGAPDERFVITGVQLGAGTAEVPSVKGIMALALGVLAAAQMLA